MFEKLCHIDIFEDGEYCCYCYSMVKIYRSFMRMAVDCVRKNGGVTRQFLGDRIMRVFIDSVDENINLVESAVLLCLSIVYLLVFYSQKMNIKIKA